MDRPQQPQCLFVRHVLAAQFDPCFAPDKIDAEKPDYIFILPWNLKDEIMKQLAHARSWGAQFIVPIPEPQIL